MADNLWMVREDKVDVLPECVLDMECLAKCTRSTIVVRPNTFINDWAVFQCSTSRKSPREYCKNFNPFSKNYFKLLNPQADKRPSAQELMDTKFKCYLPQEIASRDQGTPNLFIIY